MQKNEDGSPQALEMNQLGPDLIGIFDPLHVEANGIIQIEDIEGHGERNHSGCHAL
jgi:hypothetical protein